MQDEILYEVDDPVTIDKPIIAAVNGAVAGMAYPFALCCDLRVVTPDERLDFCRNYIVDLATKCSPASMVVMKRQVYEQLHAGLGPAERDAQRLMVESFGRPDFKEGVRSFVEKRPPQFPRIGD